ncbi:MAG: phosphatidylserine decarboxylase [Sulfurospirillum sp.]|nr:phosphatidylserine decarboxylase [Sulfurospirillum sp.]
MREHTSTQIIAKEGWNYILFFVIVLLLSYFFDFAILFAVVVLLFTIYIFRNPERLPAEDDELAILAPCDGVIEKIEKAQFNAKDMIHIKIKKSLFDVSILRSPVLMNIHNTQKRHGLFLPLTSKLSKVLGERVQIEAKSFYSDIVLVINAGIFSRKIELFKTIGPLKSSQRFCILVEGSVDLYVALDSRIKVAIADRVRSGESVLGYFSHKGNLDG